jgi:hypothetical protein
VRCLLRCGADPWLADVLGQCPKAVAHKAGHAACEAALEVRQGPMNYGECLFAECVGVARRGLVIWCGGA